MRKKLAWLLSVVIFLVAGGRLEVYLSIGRNAYAVNSSADVIEIADVQDLLAIQNAPAGKYRLVQDIDCSNAVGKAGSNSGNAQTESYLSIAFSGEIDGNGHILSGLQKGLFESIEKEGRIHGLTVRTEFSGSAWTGEATEYPAVKYTIAGRNQGRIERCTIEWKISDLEGISAECLYAYGLCEENAGMIADCAITMTIEELAAIQTKNVQSPMEQSEGVQLQTAQEESNVLGMYVAGVAGDNCQDIRNCAVILQVSENHAEQMYVGGICLQNSYREPLQDDTQSTPQAPKVGNIAACKVTGEVRSREQGSMDFGGMAVENEGVITQCENGIDATALTLYSGGIAAQNRNRITECRNLGTLTATGCLEGFGCMIGEIAGSSEGIIRSCEEEGAVVHGEAGNQLVFFPEEYPLMGDVDGDGEITMKDVVLLRRFMAGDAEAVQQKAICDTDGDGSVTSADVVILLRYLAGY